MAGRKYERVSRKSVSTGIEKTQHFSSLDELFLRNILYKAIEDFFFLVYIASFKHEGSWKLREFSC